MQNIISAVIFVNLIPMTNKESIEIGSVFYFLPCCKYTKGALHMSQAQDRQ